MSNTNESSDEANALRSCPKFDPMATDFAVAGDGFLRMGLDRMYQYGWAQGAWVQPAVANMAIGVELLCKSHLAAANPLLLFNKVQEEVAWAVHKPGFGFGDVPYERIHTLIEAGGTKTVGLAECIRLLQARFPSKIQLLGEWGRRLAGWRAVCVHFVLPDVETRAVQRVAFAALSIAQLLGEEKTDRFRRFSLRSRATIVYRIWLIVSDGFHSSIRRGNHCV